MSHMRLSSTLLLLVACLTLSAAVFAKNPQSGSVPGRYSYTPAQAELGKTVYTANCAACHGNRMEGKDDGMDDAPPLAGARFDARWRARPQALYDKVKRSMPQDDPGILSQEQATDVVAAILRVNHVAPAP